ncbi:MAG TPA: hypothetical protein VIF35_11615 [Streptosporangiaceae bacterium]
MTRSHPAELREKPDTVTRAKTYAAAGRLPAGLAAAEQWRS